MSVFHPTPVHCSCGRRFEAALLRSANVDRMPSLRSAILKGSFHRAICPGCGRTFNIESTFFYTDLGRKSLFMAFPRSQRYAYKEHGRILESAVHVFPSSLLDPEAANLRVVYGLDELREKLVAQDAGYDDRALEYLKVHLLAAHPVLTQRNRVQLILQQHTRSQVQFVAYHHNDPQIYQLTLPRSVADAAIAANSQWLQDHAADASLADKALSPAAQLDSFWVNFRNWSSRYDSLQVLHSLAEDIRAGKLPALSGPDFEKLLQTLPQGVGLSTPAKQDLSTLFDYSHQQDNQPVERRLLEIRFGKQVDNEWVNNTDETALPILWQVLRSLPASNVEGNASFKTLELDGVNGGMYTDGTGLVEIGSVELDNLTELAETLRHEVGHSVNEQLRPVVDPWLVNTFGWKMYPDFNASNADWAAAVNQWAQAMGGWGPATSAEQQEIIAFLQDCLVQSSVQAGNGSPWGPAMDPPFPEGHAWRSDQCLPAAAYRQSGGGAWYSNCAGWLLNGKTGKKFAVNFYYGNLMEVDASAIDDYVLKEARKDHYGAMSMAEFFAELYALYFDPVENPAKIIAPPVLTWLQKNIGPMAPGNPSPIAAPAPAASLTPARADRKPAGRAKSGSQKKQKNAAPKSKSSSPKRKPK